MKNARASRDSPLFALEKRHGPCRVLQVRRPTITRKDLEGTPGSVSVSTRTVAWTLAVAMVSALGAVPVAAQEPVAIAEPATAISSQAGSAADDTSGTKRFVRDVAGDYKNFFSIETALWLGVGGGAALAVHPADQRISDAAYDANDSLPGGSEYGSQYLQVPVAIAWWAIASAAGSERHAATGRDLLRAQIAVFSWTYAIKLVADRTRPNGDAHSFPSGHASTSFATAMVLQDHYGWKVGLPAFLAASYTAASRVAANQHWASDVVFGAALGMASARTVTIKFRQSRLAVSPVVAGKHGALLVSVVRPHD